MKLGVLFSGGKDSVYSLFKVMKEHEVKCLITIKSENEFSYMFHTPNINITKLQAESLGIPIIEKTTKGEKEEELKDLIEAIKQAKEKYQIKGIVTGAIESVYQKSRIQKICNDLNLECINPLWKIDQTQLLRELVNNKFKVMISGIAAYPLDNKLIGRLIDNEIIAYLFQLFKKHKLNPSGEGGELETTVLDCPIFKKKIIIEDFKITGKKYNHNFIIKKAKLIEK